MSGKWSDHQRVSDFPQPADGSPSINVVTPSDFTVTGPLDDGSLLDLTAMIPHGTFYLKDGNVEVLCSDTVPCPRERLIPALSCVLSGVCLFKLA